MPSQSAGRPKRKLIFPNQTKLLNRTARGRFFFFPPSFPVSAAFSFEPNRKANASARSGLFYPASWKICLSSVGAAPESVSILPQNSPAFEAGGCPGRQHYRHFIHRHFSCAWAVILLGAAVGLYNLLIFYNFSGRTIGREIFFKNITKSSPRAKSDLPARNRPPVPCRRPTAGNEKPETRTSGRPAVFPWPRHKSSQAPAEFQGTRHASESGNSAKFPPTRSAK